MPVIHTHVSVPTTPEQREALKAAYGMYFVKSVFRV